MDFSLLITLLYILFVFSSVVLVVVVLLQEGKGGGFGDALGVAGQQTFGVKASGIHRFTAIVAGVFFVSAVLITYLNRVEGQQTVLDDTLLEDSAPATGGNQLPIEIPK